MRLTVGCPVRARMWALPHWREAVLAAAAVASTDYGIDPDAVQFVHVVGEDDTEALDWLVTLPNTEVRVVAEPVHADFRDWNAGRLTHITWLRNQLLGMVRAADPDLFLSLDSDIFLHPDALASMLETGAARHPGCWAVGGKTWMTESTAFPSYGFWRPDMGAVLRRNERSDVIEVDVIMAIKLMTRRGYAINYDQAVHEWDDIGWCTQVKAAGGHLWWDGRVASKHVLKPHLVDTFDPRCNF